MLPSGSGQRHERQGNSPELPCSYEIVGSSYTSLAMGESGGVGSGLGHCRNDVAFT